MVTRAPRVGGTGPDRPSGGARVTVLIDNRLARAGLEREHGLSLWVQTGTANVVIDTGETAAFRRNAAALGVDLATADAVVIETSCLTLADEMDIIEGVLQGRGD